MNMQKDKLVSIEDENSNLKIKPVFIDFHNLKMEGSYEYPIHRHINYEVIVIEKGPYHCTVNSNKLTVEKDNFLIVTPGDIHQDHLYKGQSHFVLHFSINMNSIPIELLDSNCSPKDQVFHIDYKWNPLDFFKLMQDDYKESYTYMKYIQDSMMEQFFWRMLKYIPDNLISDSFKGHTKGYMFKSKLLDYFRKSYRENLTVDNIANALNISRRSLTYNCQEYFGKSPAKLFTVYRLERATEQFCLENSL